MDSETDLDRADLLSPLHQISGCEDDARKADVVFLHGLGGES